MGITFWFSLQILILAAAAVSAFLRNKKATGIIAASIMFLEIAVLAFLWLRSPM